jgi:capsular exopolysaccharide synthesis family protein
MNDQDNSPNPPEQPRLGGRTPAPQNGDGAGSRGGLEAARAAQYGMDPYGGGYGGYGSLGARNRFQETSALMARLHRYELALRKHWWILALALLVSLGPASYHILTTPASYQSTGKLWLSGKLDIKENQLYSEELSSFMGTQVELLKSATVYARALTNILAHHPGLRSVITNFVPGEANSPFKLTVTDFPKTAVIEVKGVGKEREAVPEFINSLMEEYQNFRKGVRTNTSEVTLFAIQDDVKKAEQDVKKMQELLQAFLKTNDVVLLQEAGSSAGAIAANLNKQLTSLKTELNLLELITPELLAQTSHKSLLLPSDEPSAVQGTAKELNDTLAGPQADFFRASQQIQLLKVKRDELLEWLLPIHPKILKYDETIAEQEKIIDVFKKESLTQMANRRAAITLQIKSLETETKEWEAKALDATRRMTDYDRLRADVQRKQGLFEKLLGVIQQVDVNRTLDQEMVRVMDAASKPKPVRRTALFLGLGLAAGLFLGLGLLYFVSLFDDRFSSLTELANQVSETVIGQVPEMRSPKSGAGLELIGADDTRHAFSEAFRNLRSWVLFSCEKSKQPRMLLVTSSVPVEGKSTISSNLAVTLALSGSRVLLIDADLRRAGLNELFGVDGDTGLADVLEQRASYEDLVRQTNIKNLWLLPAGMGSVNPGELFIAPSCELLLSRLRKHYDYVVLDSAPVLATDDTANLAPKIDAVLYIVRADFTSARNAREGISQLRQRKANILGLIFNRAAATRTGGYHYRYNDYYYYGHYNRYDRHGYYGRRRKKTETPPTGQAPPANEPATTVHGPQTTDSGPQSPAHGAGTTDH